MCRDRYVAFSGDLQFTKQRNVKQLVVLIQTAT